VAVFRVSGPAAAAAIETLTQENIPNARAATLRTFHAANGMPIDKGLVIWFPAPNSFTGEDVAEFHTHGGRAVTQAMLAALAAAPNCRMAEPGEFTRRAFEHGKLDLTQAEAIADLVDAETETQRVQALRQLEGSLGALYHGWADRITKTLAHLEAYLDFPDEPLPPELAAAHTATLAELVAAITAHLADAHKGERLRDGIRIAIIGAPNAGKSSLLNALAAREAAIVSPIAGTTRDVVEVALNMGGYPVLLQDTAGLRTTTDPIEAEGVRRAAARAADADLKLAVFDSTITPDADTLAQVDERTIVVLNKVDRWTGV
jgi:tRNA modification GTPase